MCGPGGPGFLPIALAGGSIELRTDADKVQGLGRWIVSGCGVRLPTAELTAPQPIVFGSLIRTLHHVYAMDYVWQCHLLGKPHGLTTRNPVDCPDIATLVAQQHQMDKWYVDYADSITDQTLAEVIGFDFIGGGRGAMSRRDIILHVVNHTTYHRGHVADMLYRLNISPPTTDLPVFAREHAVAPGTVSVI